MAPLPQYLRLRKVLLFYLFVYVLFASSFLFVFASLDHQVQQPHILLGRRTLLERTYIEDDNDDDIIVAPKKKKSSSSASSYEDESLVAPKKKKSSSSSDEDHDELLLVPKKKKSSSSSSYDEIEDLLVPKKKKVSSFDDDKPVALKKKKSSASIDADDVQEEVPKKKKPSVTSSLSDDEDEVPKKKKKSLVTSSLSDDEDEVPKKKKSSTSLSSAKNQTKLTKPSSTSSTKDQTKLLKTTNNEYSSKKNQTKLIKPMSTTTSSKNKTKLIKPTSQASNDSSLNTPTLTKLKLKKLNSTSKSSNPTKSTTQKSFDQPKPNPATKTKALLDKIKKSGQETNKKAKVKSPAPPSWMYQDDEDGDLVSEFRDLPNKFHQTFIPDLHRISTTSKVYLNQYNKEMTKGFKPYVGNKYASSAATAISCAFIIVPFLLVSLIFNQIKAYFSLQKLIIFIQIYLSIYFSILCLSSMITGLEPLRFFYATSQSTYVWLQVLQTLAYVLYLLLLLMYLVLVFSTESDLGQKFLGLAQTFVGFAVGLHYYITVFHRVVLRQPPKTNWKIHGIYAACFLLICLFARAENRKKAYLEEGGEQGKKS